MTNLTENKKLLILSLEATSVDPNLATLQQVTLTLANINETQEVIKIKESVIFVDEYTEKDFFDPYSEVPLAKPLSYKGVESLQDSIKRLTKDQTVVVIQKALEYADYIVMHNGLEYHIPLLKKAGVDFNDKLVIDTSKHIDYAKTISSRKLPLLCTEHNFSLYDQYDANNTPLIRTSCSNQALITLLNLYSVEQVVQNAILDTEDKILVVARISYGQNEEAKKLGFRYNASLKRWCQRVTQQRYEELVSIMGQDLLEVFAE